MKPRTRSLFAQPLDFTAADETFRERFWSKVDRRGPGECWLWLAYRKPNGYGQFTVVKGTFMTASRVAMALTIGRPLLQGELACHTCDNPPCVNPSHLFPGSGSVNAFDSVEKGRANRAKGIAHPSAKLTEEQVREIRTHSDRFGLAEELGRSYGVAGNTIRSIRNGSNWGHVA